MSNKFGTQDIYEHVLEFPALAPGASITRIVNIETGSHFMLHGLSYFADLAGAAQTENSRVIPLVKVALQDSGSNRSLSSAPVPVSAYAGGGEGVYKLPIPREFVANSRVSVTMSNFSDTTTYGIHFTLHGVKRWVG